MGLESLNSIGMAIGGAGELFKLIYGIQQMFHGNSQLNKLEANRPQYEIPQEYNYNQALAGQAASGGLPDSAKNFYADSIERGLGSTIGASLKTGQGLGAINNAYSSSTDAFRQLLAMDSEQKLKNQGLLMDANKELANQKLSQQDWNKFLPYQEKFNQYTNQTNAGAQNVFGGSQGLGSMGALFGSGGNDDFMKLFQQLFSSSGGGGGNFGGRSGGGF